MRTAKSIFRRAVLFTCTFAFCAAMLRAQNTAGTVWRFDHIHSVGGHRTTVLGHPHLVKTPYGKAVEFNGVDDGLVVGVHPLAHAATFTWEVIFRPDGGAAQQRFFHLQEIDPATGADTANRMTLEIRVVNGEWCLDSFNTTNGYHLTLLNCEHTHPLRQWYRVTFVYDGKELRNYVGDELQGSGEIELAPQGEGHASIGVRLDRMYYFKGAVLMARMTPRALQPSEFLAFPPAH